MPNVKNTPFKPQRPGASAIPSSQEQTQPGPVANSAASRRPPTYTTAPLDDESDTDAGFESLPATMEVLQANHRAPAPDTGPAKKPKEEAAIPHTLLATLVNEHFVHDDTRITREAMSMLSKYIEVFTLEAVVRAGAIRDETVQEAARNGQQVDDSFLELEDLEKLAPQLLMDV